MRVTFSFCFRYPVDAAPLYRESVFWFRKAEVQGYLEAWKPGPELVPLSGDRVTIGKDPSNDVVIASDATVSRLHAVLERFS